MTNSNEESQKPIAERLKQIPKLYRSLYKRAMTGKSRKAAMHAQCLECVGWQIKEVHACSDIGCSIFPYRPKPRTSQETPQSVPNEPELKKIGKGGNNAG